MKGEIEKEMEKGNERERDTVVEKERERKGRREDAESVFERRRR